MRTITISLMVLAVLVVGGMSITIAGWDYDESLGPDIIDGLMQIPPHVKKQYGGTDKERVVCNIAELLVTRKDHTTRIKALEARVKALEKLVADLKGIVLKDLEHSKASLEKSGKLIEEITDISKEMG